MNPYFKNFKFSIDNAINLHKLYFGYTPFLPKHHKEGAAQWIGETVSNAFRCQIKKLTKMSQKTYYLFGQQATDSFYDTGSIQQIIDEKIENATHCFDPKTDPKADELLAASDGWDGSAELTEDEYNLLNDED